MSADEFARLFCPKVALCGRVLDVSVDGLRFVSFPVRLKFDEGKAFQAAARRKRAKERMRTRQRHRANGQTKGNHHSTTVASSVTANSTTTGVTTATSTSSPLVSSATPTRDPSLVSDTCVDTDEDDSAPPLDDHELTFFNVVFVLSGGVSPELAACYGHVATQLARALLHEQTRAHFVSQQAQILVSIREKYLHALNRHAVGAGTGANSKKMQADFHALNHLLLSHSLLANHLHQLYYGLLQQEFHRFGGGALGMIGEDTHGLAMNTVRGLVVGSTQAEGVANVSAAFTKLGSTMATNGNSNQSNHSATTQSTQTSTSASLVARNAATRLLQVDHTHTTLLLNNWFPLHFSLATLPTPVSPNDKDSNGTASLSHSPHPPTLDLRPYQTMILTIPSLELLASLPADASPLLRRVISQADPRVSFHSMAESLHVPLYQVYRLVTHLAYWNKAIIIEVIRGDNIYTLSEKVGLGANSTRRNVATTLGVGLGSSARRSASSSRPTPSQPPTTSTSSSSSSSSSGSSKLRRRSASFEIVAPPPTPVFVPPTLMYEWTALFPSGATGLLAMLARISSRQPRTLTQHLQRLTQSHSSSTAHTTSSSSNPFAGIGLKLKHQLHSDFISQLVFLLRKQWIVQVQRWFIRIPIYSNAAYGTEDDSTDEEEIVADIRSRPISRTSSTHSLRKLNDLSDGSDSGSSLDPWRQLFERLAPIYFDGQHSLTEILWSERASGLTWQHIQHLIQLYPDELITVQHP